MMKIFLEFPETPTKVDFAPICNFLTPETEDDDSSHEESKSVDSKRVEKGVESETEKDESEWMTIYELFSGMEKDSYPKMVPCPIEIQENEDTHGRISDRHRRILIEWLIEVATEEKFRRYDFEKLIFIKNFHVQGIPSNRKSV